VTLAVGGGEKERQNQRYKRAPAMDMA